MKQAKQSGFTLIEVMITVAIIGILAAIAYPSYTEYVLRGNRSEGLALLSEAAARQERYFAQNNTYADTAAKLNVPVNSTNNLYQLNIADVTSNTYTLTVVPQNQQTKDTKCGTLGLNQKAERSKTGSASSINDCWK
ncbi:MULTISPECIES: type IV pilin protein [Pseudomonas]|jgi:type IV pilus assembly protein PilE|uniref:Pilus assembly protein PilE n=1 Tax=Pseudomonas marincola TaxID=437900 RepID=A0A1I6ZKT5_9PSED|nr:MULTISPECIES: type IV pilin protein [Pseudomonas]MAB99611.1 type IV pilin protein [Pseudomonadaceae bacterium]MBQ56833.1 type IV pilin protein [Pseudomonadaceae bacterium]NRH27194.1 type IV pilin protein [Pseudomonas sp. MS19]CAE6944025.1 Type IV pilus non-core minor pilin PilE [Pseudomonas marincola]SFT63324.1 type IV pilus assembly protein PilE [Pseudomonas marincola]